MISEARNTNFIPAVDIRIYAVLISCLFSLITILSNPILNNDAFGYLRAAELFSSEGISYILNNYGWYGYSILIATINKILPLGLLNSAHLLNIASYGLLVYCFITLVTEYKNTQQLKIFASIIILVFPLINEMRFFLIRDFAFWAFGILALHQLIRFHKTLRISYGLGWCLAIFMAIFFRLEGIVLLVLTPFSIFLNNTIPLNIRFRNYLKIQAILLVGISLVLLICAVMGVDIIALIQYAYRYYLPGIYNITDILAETSTQLNQVIFDPQNFPGNSGHGLVILIFAYIYTLAVILVSALSIPLSVLFLYGLFSKKYRLSTECTLPLIFFMASSLISLLIFMFIMHFLTQRYAVLSCIMLLSLLPLCLDNLYLIAIAQKKLKRFNAIFAFFIFYFTVASLISFGYSKRYIKDASEWTKNNLNENSQLYTNNYSIAFFSEMVEEYDKINRNPAAYIENIQAGEYLVVDVRVADDSLKILLREKAGLKLLEIFANNRDDQIRIYRFN